jgi:signal transduction histidine kinase
MQKTFSEETYLTIITSTALLLFFVVLMVYYFFRLQKKRFQHEQEVTALRENFNRAILQSRLEIHELALDHIAKELHANFSHLGSLININLAAALAETTGSARKYLIESKQLAKQLMAELKFLSVSMNSDHLMKTGFYKAFTNEMQRLERTGKYEVVSKLTGEPVRLPPEKEIILLRLCQEILNNIIRHSKATKIIATIEYTAEHLFLGIEDNGVGFDSAEAKERSVEKASTGLMNIAGRALLIKGELSIESQKGKGTCVSVTIPLSTEKSNYA